MNIIFYDVDTQVDFMNSSGALYVPDAELIKQNLLKLTQNAVKYGIPIFGSVDWHFNEDSEFSENGGPFPRHCMSNTDGVRKIPETTVNGSYFIPNPIREMWDIRKYEMVIKSHNAVYFQKQHYDVTTNPEFNIVMGMIKPGQVFIYGVAEDFCVKAAAEAFIGIGVKTCIVQDATKAVFPSTVKKIDRAIYLNTEDVLSRVYQ